jgi:AbrB family looped-hinge helix DNA binding protein
MKLGKSKVWVQGGVSLAIVIPQLVAENLGIKAGDIVEWYIEDGDKIVLKVAEG